MGYLGFMEKPKNKTYLVYVREVWVRGVQIDAVSEEEAREKIMEGQGEDLDSFEYSHISDDQDEAIASIQEMIKP